MNRQAIFSDGTIDYRCPVEPKPGDFVRICIRAFRGDVLHVHLCTKDKKILMTPSSYQAHFTYYSTDILLSEDIFSYWFQISDGNEIVYYDRYGLYDHERPEYALKITPGFSTPDWAKGAVMYQILVDRFAKGDPATDVVSGEYYYIGAPVEKVDDWNEPPKAFDVGRFYGGDLTGVKNKLKYLKSLGIEAIYFNPLFVSPSNHKYDGQDFDYIDPHYGKIVNDGGEALAEDETDNTKATKYIKRVTDKENLRASNELFANLVKEAHELGIKVIIDGVFNHCGSFHKWMDKEGIYKDRAGFGTGAYWSEDSPYKDYFSFAEGSAWPKNASYDGWWSHDTLPKLNYEGSQRLQEEILGIAKKWVSYPYNVDGWRLDVAADLGHSQEYNHSFWQKFRQTVKEANPEAIIIAEHYGDPSAWLQGNEWDTVMNYDAFMDPVSYFLTGMEKHSDEFESEAIGDGERFELTMRHAMTRFNQSSLFTAMNQLSNHDHSRFLTRTNHKVGRVGDLGSEAASEDVDYAVFRQGVVMQMTWPGAPTLYYGDEAGVAGFTDPDNRRTYPWDNPDDQLVDFHRDCIHMHKYSRALRLGSFIFLKCEKDLISYARFCREEKVIVIINTSNESIMANIPAWKAEISDNSTLSAMMYTNESGYSILPRQVKLSGGYLNIELEGKSACVYRLAK